MPRQLTKFMHVQTIVVPLVHEGRGLHALNIACFFAAEMTLVSVMVAPPEQSLSPGAAVARARNGIMFFQEKWMLDARIKSLPNRSQTRFESVIDILCSLFKLSGRKTTWKP